MNIFSECLQLFLYLLPILNLDLNNLVLDFVKEAFLDQDTKIFLSSVAFAIFRKLSPPANAYSPNFSLFSELIRAFSRQELNLRILVKTSDVPSKKPVLKISTALATAAAVGNDLLDLCFFLVSVPFRKEDTSIYILFRSLWANKTSFFCFSWKPINFEVVFAGVCEIKVALVGWCSPQLLKLR